MARAARAVSRLQLETARRQAARMVSSLAVTDADRERLAECAALYLSAEQAGASPAGALEAATGLSANGDPPVSVRGVERLEDLLEHVKRRPEDAGGLLAGTHAALRASSAGERIAYPEATYERSPPLEKPVIVGHDGLVDDLSGRVRQLFCYDPVERRNPEAGRMHAAVLLSGPPGTGKSSLCRYALAEGEELSALTGLPFRYELFAPSDFSKWVGESAQNLSAKYGRVRDASGVGVLVIDDIDMVLQSRQDAAQTTGMLHVTGQLMQLLSGIVDAGTGNALVIGTTNRPDQLDDALERRFGETLEVPSFSVREQYAAFMRERLPSSADARDALADHAYSAGLSPARCEDLVRAVQRSAIGYPSREDLLLPRAELYAAREGLRVGRGDVQKYLSEGL